MGQPASNEVGARVRVPPPLVFLAALLCGVAFHHAVVPGAIPPSARIFLLVAGIVLAVGGLGLVVSARTQFVRTGQQPAPWKPTPELIFAGPYRFTRNPMYVGMTLLLVGLGLAFDVWICAFAPLALVAVHFLAVVPEERYLSQKFGEPYDAYRKRVRRYL
jgi:protein-S-isoprenylcysteine O-methyltransferase Ste14